MSRFGGILMGALIVLGSTRAMAGDPGASAASTAKPCDRLQKALQDKGYGQPKGQKDEVKGFVDSLGKSCSSVTGDELAQIYAHCSRNPDEERKYIESMYNKCSSMDGGKIAGVMNSLNGGDSSAFLNEMGLDSFQKGLKEKANKCGAQKEVCSKRCTATGSSSSQAFEDCQQTIDKFASAIGEQADGVAAVLDDSKNLVACQSGAKGCTVDPSTKTKCVDGKCSPTEATGGGGDPKPAATQPQGGEQPPGGDQSAPGSTADNTGGDGGLGGLGSMMQQLLPLAMMAALMNQGDDDAEQEVEKDPIAEFCVDNPDSQVCVTEIDCSNEEIAALNPQQCLCADPEVARVTPICNQKPLPTNTAGLTQTPTVQEGRGLLGSTGLTDLLGSQGFTGGAVEGGAVGVDANMRGGGGGGGPQAAGGPAAKMDNGGGGGYGPGPYNTDILKGVGRSGGGAGAAGGGGYAYGAGANGSDDEGDENFNLKKYLPNESGGRALAGMSIKATDGLTGPFGPTIWQKISQRYKKVKPYLKP